MSTTTNVTHENDYTKMQADYYESTADLMNQGNHMIHNGNQDYWDILVNDTESDYRNKTGLDFGCGTGRNVQNIWMRFARMDGVDISMNNLVHAERNILEVGAPADRVRLYHCNGVDLSGIPDNEYDFIMSTIVMQHICVYDIRLNYLREFARIAKPGALLSFQMGYGEGHAKAGYYDNHWDAMGTNSRHNTAVTDPEQVRKDLEEVGFTNFSYSIRPAFDDGHREWIFVKAYRA